MDLKNHVYTICTGYEYSCKQITKIYIEKTKNHDDIGASCVTQREMLLKTARVTQCCRKMSTYG